jgi:hypothetical protein
MADFNGTDGADTFTGTEENEEIKGLDGADDLRGGAGNDLIDGGKGADTLNGGLGNDILRGRDGNDLLIDTDGGNDVLGGGEGDNTFQVTRSSADNSDRIEVNGGSGRDTLTFTGNAANSARLEANLGKGDNTATVTDVANLKLEGGRGVDTLDVSVTQGGQVRGGGANDVISAQMGATGYLSVSLGAGDDRLNLNTDSGGAYRLSLNEGKSGVGKDVVTLDGLSGESAELVRVMVKHFAAGDTGDKFELRDYLRDVLKHFKANDNPFETGHMQLVQTGSDVRLQIDVDGADRDANGFVDFIIFHDTDVDDLTAFNLGGYDPDAAAG